MLFWLFRPKFDFSPLDCPRRPLDHLHGSMYEAREDVAWQGIRPGKNPGGLGPGPSRGHSLGNADYPIVTNELSYPRAWSSVGIDLLSSMPRDIADADGQW